MELLAMRIICNRHGYGRIGAVVALHTVVFQDCIERGSARGNRDAKLILLLLIHERNILHGMLKALLITGFH